MVDEVVRALRDMFNQEKNVKMVRVGCRWWRVVWLRGGLPSAKYVFW